MELIIITAARRGWLRGNSPLAPKTIVINPAERGGPQAGSTMRNG
ncbi:MAG: hypothetical protein WBE38_12275 [Terracidiphilus sp.]